MQPCADVDDRSNKSPPSPRPRPKNPRVDREFDPARYSTRLIAIKFAYLGQRYNGFEHHANNKTPLPTVEDELWKAFNKARLIFPAQNPSLGADEFDWEGCEYSKCGRTDKGVSAFGQVIGIRVRSNRPLAKAIPNILNIHHDSTVKDIEVTSKHPNQEYDDYAKSIVTDSVSGDSPSFHPIHDEIPYAHVLNRLLPPDIRISAWCPTPPAGFSARFSCKERRYRYFFTQPAFTPTVQSYRDPISLDKIARSGGVKREGWLDVEAMQDGAKRFVGLHDFRNFCKVDPSKQIDNFDRRIFHAQIKEVDPESEPAAYVRSPGFQEYERAAATDGHVSNGTSSSVSSSPKIYMFELHGSAFLWHQVRHMMAILFLIGQGLESPDVVSQLLDIRKNPQKPMYMMAEDVPLVLWDCIFPLEGSDSRDDALEWVYVGDKPEQVDGIISPPSVKTNGKFGMGGVVDDMWKVWRRRKMDEVLAGMLLNVLATQGNDATHHGHNLQHRNKRSQTQKVYYGGDAPRHRGKYVPVLDLPRMEAVEAINKRYAERKGFEQRGHVRGTGFRQVELNL